MKWSSTALTYTTLFTSACRSPGHNLPRNASSKWWWRWVANSVDAQVSDDDAAGADVPKGSRAKSGLTGAFMPQGHFWNLTWRPSRVRRAVVRLHAPPYPLWKHVLFVCLFVHGITSEIGSNASNSKLLPCLIDCSVFLLRNPLRKMIIPSLGSWVWLHFILDINWG